MPSLKDSISEYKGIHSGEEAWLFGKGIGLDYFDYSEAGSLRFTVNHACHVVPAPTYCCSCHHEDYTCRSEPIPEGCEFLIAPEEDITTVGELRHVDLENRVFQKKYSSSEFTMSFAIYTGVRKIHIVGHNPEHSHSSHFLPYPKKTVLKYIKDMHGDLRFERDKRMRQETKDIMFELAKKYNVEVVDYNVDLPPYTIKDMVDSIKTTLPRDRLSKYVRRNKKKS